MMLKYISDYQKAIFSWKKSMVFPSWRLSSVSRILIANGNSKMRRKSGSGTCNAKFSRRTCRACVRVRKYARENTTWAFLGVERRREEGLPDRDDHLIVTRDHEQDRHFFKAGRRDCCANSHLRMLCTRQ